LLADLLGAWTAARVFLEAQTVCLSICPSVWVSTKGRMFLDAQAVCLSVCLCVSGWVSAKGRVPYIILALMDVMRTYPGQVTPSNTASAAG
jgi:hypothetical protein